MAFWALGALDKVKKYSVGEVARKFKDYVQVDRPEKHGQQQQKPQCQQAQSRETTDTRIDPEQLMQLQLTHYKKLLELQEAVLTEHREKEQEQVGRRSRQLEKVREDLENADSESRRTQARQQLLQTIQSGKRAIREVIEENITIKEQLLLANSEASSF